MHGRTFRFALQRHIDSMLSNLHLEQLSGIFYMRELDSWPYDLRFLVCLIPGAIVRELKLITIRNFTCIPLPTQIFPSQEIQQIQLFLVTQSSFSSWQNV